MLSPPMSAGAGRAAVPIVISSANPGTSAGVGGLAMAAPSASVQTAGKKLQRKRKRWTKDEEGFLWAGVQKHGVGAWSIILADSEYSFEPQRTAVDLKDKWRVLTVRRPPTAPPPPIDPSTLPRAPPPNKRAREASPERANRTIAVAAVVSPAAEPQSPPLPTPAASSPGGRGSQAESQNQSPAAAEQEARGRSRSRSSSLSPLPPSSVWTSIHSDWFASFSALPPPDTWLTGPACALLPDDLRSASVDPLFSSGSAPAPAFLSSATNNLPPAGFPSFPQFTFTQPPPHSGSSTFDQSEPLASPSSSSTTAGPAPMCPFTARLAPQPAPPMPDAALSSSDLTHGFEYHDYSADESDDDLSTDNEWSMPAMAHGEPLFPFASSPIDASSGVDHAQAAVAASPDMGQSLATSGPSPTQPSDLVPRRTLQPMVWNPARFFGAFNPPPAAPPAPPGPPTDSRTALKAELTDAITRARIAGDELKAHHESIVLKLMTSSGRSVHHVPQADLFNCRHHPKVDHRVMPRLRPGALAWRPRSVSPIASPRVRPVDARPLARAVVTGNDPVHAAMAKASASNKKRGRSEPAPVTRRKAAGAGRRSGGPLGGTQEDEEGEGEGNDAALIPHAISEATDLALAEMLDAALQLDESTRTAALRLLGNRSFARNSSRLESLAFRALRLTATDILRMGMHPSEETLPNDPVAAAAAVKPSEHMYARIKKGHSHMQAKLLQAAAANGTRALTN